jgi:hypothetical protein
MNKQDHHKRYSDYKLTPLLEFGHQLLVSETLNVIFSHLLVNYLFLLFSQIFKKLIWTLKLKMKKSNIFFIWNHHQFKSVGIITKLSFVFPDEKDKSNHIFIFEEMFGQFL